MSACSASKKQRSLSYFSVFNKHQTQLSIWIKGERIIQSPKTVTGWKHEGEYSVWLMIGRFQSGFSYIISFYKK